MTWWPLALYEQSPVLLVSWIFWVIASITLHELAHGWTAIRHGDDTPILTGHMTVNPIVHMGPMSLVAFALLGFAWGAMPIDPTRLRGRHAEAMVAGAGPVMNVGLAGICVLCSCLVLRYLPPLGVSFDIAQRLHLFFFAGGMLNVVLALFNLAPIPPLDGSRIAAAYSRRYVDFAQSSLGQGVLFIAMALMFFTSGRVLFPMAARVFFECASAVDSLLPSLPTPARQGPTP